MKRIKQFDLWLADLNPSMGTEPGKVRPVMIMQTNLLNASHPSTIVCPLTTRSQPDVAILRVHLKKSASGLKQDCDVMIDQLRAIDNRRLIRKTGDIDGKVRMKIRENLRIILDLE